MQKSHCDFNVTRDMRYPVSAESGSDGKVFEPLQPPDFRSRIYLQSDRCHLRFTLFESEGETLLQVLSAVQAVVSTESAICVRAAREPLPAWRSVSSSAGSAGFSSSRIRSSRAVMEMYSAMLRPWHCLISITNNLTKCV